LLEHRSALRVQQIPDLCYDRAEHDLQVKYGIHHLAGLVESGQLPRATFQVSIQALDLFLRSLALVKLPLDGRVQSRPGSLSRAGIRRLRGAASFPTLFSTATGVVGLIAGPSSVLRSLDY
jgi:hypothetical protein